MKKQSLAVWGSQNAPRDTEWGGAQEGSEGTGHVLLG